MVAQHEEIYEMAPLQEGAQEVIRPCPKVQPKSKAAPMPAMMTAATEVMTEMGRSMGCHGHHDSSGHHERPTTGDDRCSAKPGAKHGERDGGDPESCAPSQSASPVDHILNAGDWGKDFDHDHHQTHHMNSRHKKFQELVHQFTKELQEVSNWEGLRQRPKLQVLEVFCSADSELTRQVNKLGYRGQPPWDSRRGFISQRQSKKAVSDYPWRTASAYLV